VGHTRTMKAATLAAGITEWTVLEAQAAAGAADLVVRLTDNGVSRSFVYRPATNDYLSDKASLGTFTRAQLEQMVTNGATLTMLGVAPGNGTRLGIDRDDDLVRDGDEPLPMPVLTISFTGGAPRLTWSEPNGPLVLEFTDELAPADWQTLGAPRVVQGGVITVTDPAPGPRRFYRLRRL
jgi:hypothetical protein